MSPLGDLINAPPGQPCEHDMQMKQSGMPHNVEVRRRGIGTSRPIWIIDQRTCASLMSCRIVDIPVSTACSINGLKTCEVQSGFYH